MKDHKSHDAKIPYLIRRLICLLGQTASPDASEMDTASSSSQIPQQRQVNDLLNARFEEARKVDVSLPDDVRQTWITGCCFMPGGELVLCDYGNHKVKVLDSSFEMRESANLPVAPFGVAAVDGNTVIVTLPKECQLQYIQVLPYLIKTHIKFVDKWCWGVAVATGFIYVMCDRGNYDAELRVYDVSWNLLKRIGINPDGTNNRIFEVGRYIAVSRSENKIFATDWETDTVWCLTTDGETVYQYRNEALRKPRGLFVDEKDNVIVVGWKGDFVHIILADGCSHKTLLSSKDGISGPQCVSFRPSDGIVAIGTYWKNDLLLYKMKL